MSTINYTENKAGLEKIRSMIGNEPKIVMIATRLEKIPFSVCPMTLQEMDEQGSFWFFVSKESNFFKDIRYDNRIQILYSNPEAQEYMSIFGKATHVIDKKKVHALWNSLLHSWFEGEDDPNLILLNVQIKHAYYWDNDTSKLVSFFKMLKNAITEDKSDLGNKGHISLQD
ncbi:pyridoxamine 5'-phosphate oxidase family protein [Flavivirga sp. 57AJ16]|uniref:pyridoxamine 5'-phosphate oxidase family protein n=1 Tax=Flavivirga sp. 57AJ16 TaxID=3025307 RepID=UPI002366071C|nr:pyridoxamine 5'-phosphate oxidase family protein [Flavivirga sp. 57AJ16]MDD7886592.1 pyridoxamine 5'-phosphate oxidase family protein [Flavivirga sp. 57AJ16]